jgi:hypothetical protein
MFGGHSNLKKARISIWQTHASSGGGIVISSYEVSEFPKSGFADEDGMGISSCLLDVVLSQML